MLNLNVVTDLAAAVNLEAEEADFEAAVDVGLEFDDHLGFDLDVTANVGAVVAVEDLGIA